MSDLDASDREALQSGNIGVAYYTETEESFRYLNIFQFIASLGFDRCFGVRADLNIVEWEQLQDRLPPFRLGSHTIHALAQLGTDERELLYELARNGSYAGHVVEIGSLFGGSTIILALGCKEADRGPVFAIDPLPQPELQQNLERAGVADCVRLLPYPSAAVARRWRDIVGANWQIGLLWIDANHSYETVSEDILHWQGYVEPGGYICLHDYDERTPGVICAVYEQLISSGRWESFKVVNTIFCARKSRERSPKGPRVRER